MNMDGRTRRPLLMVLALGLTVVITGFAWQAFATPVQVDNVVNKQVLKQDVSISYSGTPAPCTLYPQPQPLQNQPVYFTRVLDSFSVQTAGRIVTDPPNEVTGTSKVALRLKAGDLWERNFILSPEKPFSGSGSFTALNGTFDIPVKHILSFIKIVEEETQVTPGDGYTLSVVPVISAGTEAGAEGLKNGFAPEFTFTLSQRELKFVGENKQEQVETLTGLTSSPGSVNILGLSLPVLTARYVFGSSAVLSGGLVVWLLCTYLRSRTSIPETDKINQRFRSRLVRAQSASTALEGSVVKLASFKELLKLADERDKSIICIDATDGGTRVCRYCLPDGETVYCYIAMDETPTKRTTLKDRVKALDQAQTRPAES